ncbi:MAG TPA: hypothetical protein VMU54_19245 [Planctomycetota bacterium]|nr:hypothetical protein [Planctomycetota bacterium]
MRSLALAIAFLSASAAAYAGDEVGLPTHLSLDDEPRGQQDLEQDRQRPDDFGTLTPMEFVYKHSELEAGVMYTVFSHDLNLKSHMGFYLRYGVEIMPHIDVHVTYRYNEFGNGPRTGNSEDLQLQALFIGAGIHIPLHQEFAFVAGAGIGPMWWDSTVATSPVGFGLTAEAALTARIWEALRLKLGLVLDGVSTDFHQTSTNFSLNLSYLLGFEIEM